MPQLPTAYWRSVLQEIASGETTPDRSPSTRAFEQGLTDPRRALEKAGVVFLDKDKDGGPAVRLNE